MSDVDRDPTVEPRDAQAARDLVDAWLRTGPYRPEELRGMVTQLVADTRAAGLAEGYAAGRRAALYDAQAAVQEALEGL